MATHIHLYSKTRDEAPKLGDEVHMGNTTPGGSGVKGILTKIDGGWAYLKNDEGREFRGALRNVTKE